MGGFAKEVEVCTSLPPAKAFKAFAEDLDTLLPTVAPQAIKRVERLEGDGGPGTIKKITFAEGYGFSYAKHRVDVLDKDNLSYTYVVIESDFFNNMVEKISYETKFVAAADGGTSIKNGIPNSTTTVDVIYGETHTRGNLGSNLWSLKMPFKLVNVRTMNSCLPCKVEIQRRIGSAETNCAICLEEDESEDHLFLSFPFTRTVWLGKSFAIRSDAIGTISIKNWTHDTVMSMRSSAWDEQRQMDTLDLIPLAYVLWGIWTH